MWDGAAPIRIGEKDIYESVVILINSGSLALQGELLHSQATEVSATAEWLEGTAPEFSSIHLYGNAIHLAELDFESTDFIQVLDLNVSGNDVNQTEMGNVDLWVNRITWSLKWVVNFKQFKDEYGVVDLNVIGITKDGRQIVSGVKTAKIRPLDYNDPISTAAMFYKDITGETPSASDIDLLIPNVATGSLGGVIESIVDYSNQGEYQFMADIIAAYQVLYGSYHSSSSAFFSEYSPWRETLINDRIIGLKAYITEQIQSPSYTSRYGTIPIDQEYFFGLTEGTNFVTRKEFVTRHFVNKYKTSPSVVQYVQGTKKMWEFAGMGAAYTSYMMNRLAAVDFIYNLATEPTSKFGISGNITETYLNNLESLRPNYLDKAKQFALSQADSHQSVADEAINAEESNSRRVLDAIIEDPNLRRRFNLLWEDSPKENGLDYWKHEPWFGHFMDEKYPWIYHVDLGWLYSNGTTQKNIWFYSQSLGWFWTNREIFKDHPNLSSENQRFIYRVRASKGGGWQGSWSLLTLPIAGTGSTEINLYDYGYNPF